MKLCVFSDIHGNGDAFEAVYASILKEKVDMHICLGDTAGYYTDETAIIARLKGLKKLITVRGNHDAMFVKAVEGDGTTRATYEKRYSSALEGFMQKEHREAYAWLKALPVSYVNAHENFACYHASPWDPMEEYIYPDAKLERFNTLPYKYFFLGHTHHVMSLVLGDKRIINPGSVGQPRDGHWPSYAVADLKKGQVEIRYVPFDVDRFLDRIWNDPAHPYLRDVFKRIKRDG